MVADEPQGPALVVRPNPRPPDRRQEVKFASVQFPLFGRDVARLAVLDDDVSKQAPLNFRAVCPGGLMAPPLGGTSLLAVTLCVIFLTTGRRGTSGSCLGNA